MLRSPSWWVVMAVLTLMAIGYSLVSADSPSPLAGQGQSPAAATSPAASASNPASATSAASGSPAATAGSPGQSPAAAGATGGASPATGPQGDPVAGASVYTDNCASCHGPDLSGGIGFRLNPLQTGPQDVNMPFLVATINNGRINPNGASMPAWKGKLSDKQISDVAAFIIQQNQAPAKPSGGTPQEKMINNVWLIAILSVIILAITFGLSWYNMRWVARKSN
ncbi:MAG: c-type cytochrome [Candidatus Dormibacteria bacterium]